MRTGNSDSGEIVHSRAGSQEQEPRRYAGPERRRTADRREGRERREMIRYELDKDDRRNGPDRREDRRRFDFWGLMRRY